MDFKKLYEPYSKMATLEDTVLWLRKECVARGVRPEAVEHAILSVFTDIQNGKKFATDGGVTGFDGIPHAVLNITLLNKAIELNKELESAYIKTLEDQFNKTVKASKKIQFFNFNRSPILNWIKGR